MMTRREFGQAMALVIGSAAMPALGRGILMHQPGLPPRVQPFTRLEWRFPSGAALRITDDGDDPFLEDGPLRIEYAEGRGARWVDVQSFSFEKSIPRLHLGQRGSSKIDPRITLEVGGLEVVIVADESTPTPFGTMRVLNS